MSDSYAKLWRSILGSTVWQEPNATRIVWITMLAQTDAAGNVLGSVPGLAHAARVTVEEAEHALATFRAPDRHSRTKDNEGRRIEDIDGGWRLLNYEKHSVGRAEESRRQQAREAAARYRKKASARHK